MKSHQKLELSKETLRSLSSDLLADVQGGVNASAGTCVSCIQCTTTIGISPTVTNETCVCWNTP